MVLFILILSIGFLYSFTRHRNQHKRVDKIEIIFEKKGHRFLTDSMVNKLLIQNELNIKNQTKSIIDLYLLEKTVLANPFIEKASVFLSIQNVLYVHVTQRQAIARIIDRNKSYYIDKQGFKFPVSKNFSARVPVVSGIRTAADLKEIRRFLEEINQDDFLKNEIVGIHKTSKKEFEMHVRSGNYVIEFGKSGQMRQKFFNLKAFYSKVFSEDVMKTYKTINLKYRNQVVCTK